MFHFIAVAYTQIIYRPLLNLLVFFYNVLPGHDIGITIILLTIIIRLLLAPSFHRSLRSQRALNELQPKLNALREKHKDNREAQAKAMMELYKEHKVNPFSSCLPLLIQLPILIALNQVFRVSLAGAGIAGLYNFVKQPGRLNPVFLHLVNLSKIAWVGSQFYWPGVILAILTGLTQFWQSKLMMVKDTSGKQDPTVRAMQIQVTYVFPLLFVYIALRFVAGLALYWTATTLFTVGQQYYIMRQRPKAGV